MNEVPLSITSPPADIVNALYGGLIQSWLDAGVSILPELAPASSGPQAATITAGSRNPVEEEKVRLIVLSGLQLWYLLSRNPTTQAKIMNFIQACVDPSKWEVIANLVWGP